MAVLIPTASLKEWCAFENCVWPGLKRPVTRKEVQASLDAGKLCDTPIKGLAKPAPKHVHVARIAYLVKHGWKDPIDVDVGVPSLGCHVDWVVQDGNHRLTAAFFRGDATILMSLSGDIDYAADLFGVSAEALFDPDYEDVAPVYEQAEAGPT